MRCSHGLVMVMDILYIDYEEMLADDTEYDNTLIPVKSN